MTDARKLLNWLTPSNPDEVYVKDLFAELLGRIEELEITVDRLNHEVAVNRDKCDSRYRFANARY